MKLLNMNLGLDLNSSGPKGIRDDIGLKKRFYLTTKHGQI